ncbi:hypothetical protein SMSP2_02343 [Limihaloglobus sulfuriphilus]|uniref:Uncharacterized protein n=1 Tax=Limihaloglobus sulfuriphilus TaxID=1851148 RepID=A0A1Q2MH37_9BACT|nr:hypothetical protein [Limihaloglobus sulfuriphilus]AQQ71964.1 hypothetical protein SMSP2_02343 [Limihaloglobus sulfuriphilus]
MIFRFHNYISRQVSKQAGLSLLTAALVLAGVGFGIVLLQPLVILVLAGLFFIAAAVCLTWAVRLLITSWLYKQADEDFDEDEPYRENVRIHGRYEQ